MKNLLLSFLIALAIIPATNARADAPYEQSMDEKQQGYMRYNGVSVSILSVNDRFISRRATASYEVSLTNPYKRGIRCNIILISSRGSNEKFEVIDQKAHLGVYAPANGVTKLAGTIEIKHGRGDDGLQWVESKGHLVKAENCTLL